MEATFATLVQRITHNHVTFAKHGTILLLHSYLAITLAANRHGRDTGHAYAFLLVCNNLYILTFWCVIKMATWKCDSKDKWLLRGKNWKCLLLREVDEDSLDCEESRFVILADPDFLAIAALQFLEDVGSAAGKSVVSDSDFDISAFRQWVVKQLSQCLEYPDMALTDQETLWKQLEYALLVSPYTSDHPDSDDDDTNNSITHKSYWDYFLENNILRVVGAESRGCINMFIPGVGRGAKEACVHEVRHVEPAWKLLARKQIAALAAAKRASASKTEMKSEGKSEEKPATLK